MFGSLKMAAFLRLETLRHYGARCDVEKEGRDYCGYREKNSSESGRKGSWKKREILVIFIAGVILQWNARSR